MSFGCRSGFALPRRCTSVYFLLGFIFIFTLSVFLAGNPDLSREERMEQHVAEMQVRMEFLEAMYRMRQEEFLDLQMKIQQAARSHGALRHAALDSFSSKNPDVLALLKSMNGSRAVMGVAPKHQIQKTPFVFQLLPHLMNDPFSLRPAYHLRSFKTSVNIVIGIPTVKRDKESYLLTTLTHLIKGMSAAEAKSTILVVFIGETDLEYVINTAKQIESTFPKQVEDGLIEVLSPAHSYYPNFEVIEPTLGDSKKRTKWRTKQNLDTIYLMSYAYSRGNFYLMLEDDVIASKNYIQDIRQFTAKVTVSTPDWFFIEFCTQGGIGKLFKSSNLLHFITYVQLFYKNMPVDWLLESYLGDRVCTINKSSKQCEKSKTEIRPKYSNKSLFTHIGLFSSLKGKIQKVVKYPTKVVYVKNEKNELIKHSLYRNRPVYYPHKNPPLSRLYSDILLISEEHSLSRAYDGLDYFWGLKPLKGNVLEFWFAHPTVLESYTFRSANDAHKNDKFYNTVVEVMPKSATNFTVVGEFDEFGLADDNIDKKLGPLQAIRLRVLKDSAYWVLLSEIELKVAPGSS